MQPRSRNPKIPREGDRLCNGSVDSRSERIISSAAGRSKHVCACVRSAPRIILDGGNQSVRASPSPKKQRLTGLLLLPKWLPPKQRVRILFALEPYGCRMARSFKLPCRRHIDVDCRRFSYARRRSLHGRTATVTIWPVRSSNLGLLCHLECIVDFDAEVSNCAFRFRVTKQQLYRSQVFRSTVN